MSDPNRHGGKDVSSYLRDHLHVLIESATPNDIGEVISYTMSHGGYFKRFRGGALARWTKHGQEPPAEGSGMTLDERLTLAFLKVAQSGNPS